MSKRRSFLSFCLASNSSFPLLLANHPINVAKRLQVLAVVLGDGGGNGGGRSGSSGGGGGDAPARAGGGVVLGRSAVLDVGGDDLVVALLEGLDVALELGGLISIDGDGHGGGAVSLMLVTNSSTQNIEVVSSLTNRILMER